MAIIEDYEAIAKRLRELSTPSPKSADEITELERWRDLARETARVYVDSRRRSIVGAQQSRRARGSSIRLVASRFRDRH